MAIVPLPASQQSSEVSSPPGQARFSTLFKWLVPPLCLLAVFSYIAAGAIEATTSPSRANFMYQLLAIFIPVLAAASAAAWFASSFTGTAIGSRRDQI